MKKWDVISVFSTFFAYYSIDGIQKPMMSNNNNIPSFFSYFYLVSTSSTPFRALKKHKKKVFLLVSFSRLVG